MPSAVAPPSRHRARSRSLALLAGVAGALSLPPWGWWPLAIVGLAAYVYTLIGRDLMERALLGLLFGVGLFTIGLFWVTEFHAVGYVVLVLLETSFFVAGAAATARLVAFPATIVLAEAARGAVPFGGLPLGGLALGQAQSPFAASARVGGALLVLGVVASVAAGLVAAIRRRQLVALPLLGGAAVLTAFGWWAGDGRATGETVDTVVVQGGGRRGFRAVESDPSDVLEAHLRASEDIEAPLDLVVWPENAIDVIEIDTSDEGRRLAALAVRTRSTVVAGVTQETGDAGFENTAVVWSPQGDIVDRYTKVRRVPFGEYVPMRGFLERLVDLSVLPRDAVPGRRAGVVSSPAGRLAVSISYEVFFSDRARSGVRAGGEILLVPTNAASFTTSQVPTQEVAAAQLRAWETGRWVLQAAPTGYSAVIDARGRVRERSTLGAAALLAADVPRRNGRTIYTHLGDWPVVLAAVSLAVGPLLTSGMRGSRRDRD